MRNTVTEITDLPRETQDMIGLEVKDGEKVLWVGRPDPFKAMIKALPVFFFAVPWTAFSLFWMWGASGFGSGGGPFLLFPLFGLPFLFIGLGLLSSPFLARWSAGKTVYVLTGKRAICFLKALGTTRISSYGAERLKERVKSRDSRGGGDLVFEYRQVSGTRSRAGRPRPLGFLGLPDVDAADRIIADRILRETP